MLSKRKYNATIEETISKTFEIIAEDKKLAKAIVVNNYNLGKIVLEPGEVTSKQIKICNDNDILIDWKEF